MDSKFVNHAAMFSYEVETLQMIIIGRVFTFLKYFHGTECRLINTALPLFSVPKLINVDVYVHKRLLNIPVLSHILINIFFFIFSLYLTAFRQHVKT